MQVIICGTRNKGTEADLLFPGIRKVSREEAFYTLLFDGVTYEEAVSFSGYRPKKVCIASGRRGRK